ncbi:3'(2'), 5'-bisphosphate nucleotidase [Blastococcus colisei]|uniref:3'(2'), 5'-bisphosphate nucleotidase n=1 Tax=Blastococcus colisei TaxID=1564162 RepID=A0A543P0J4_9ACTN|nr:inositol monophosphatase family protein [Blastococcus colisei]TQN37617.1 3'(2'), 5'-bisphosphate nucleotidase [Blastococcus colisei]
MADHRVATGGPALVRAAASLGLAPAALAPAISDPAYRLLVGEDSAALLRRQWTADGFSEAVLLASGRIGPDTPAVLATAAAWGCDRVRDRPGGRGVLPVPAPRPDAPVVDRFLHLAALAATRVETAVALARGVGEDRVKADGSPSVAADEAAHLAAAEVLADLGLPLLSEERTDGHVPEDEPWVVLDPLDGTGNFRAGLPPWAFSAGLVQAGRAVAGVVVDLSSGRRWWADGNCAWRDGVPVSPRPGSTVVVPTAPPGGSISVPGPARRVRVTGCTAVELCLVADGSAAAWHDIDRTGTHVHDVAGGLAVLAAAGGVALGPDGAEVRLRPDTAATMRFVAASSAEAAAELLRAVS